MEVIKIKGTVKEIRQKEEGISQKGNKWEKIRFVLTETKDQYPETLEFTSFNTAIDTLERTSVGDELDVTFTIRGREYNGRYFTDLNVVGLVNKTKEATPKQAKSSGENIAIDEDLPF